MRRMRPHRPLVVAMLVLAGAVAFFLWPTWAFEPMDRLVIGGVEGDFLRQFYPYRAAVARIWAGGRVPLWNPHAYAGTPALADPQQAVLYPWRALQVPLAIGGRTLPLWGVTLEAAAHLWLGGLFAGLLALRLGAGRAGAALAGLAFAFGGYLTGYPMDQLAVLDTAVWLPALAWALLGALEAEEARSRWRWLGGAALLTTLGLLAGHPQTLAYGILLGLALVAWRAAGRRVAPGRAAGLALAWLAAALALGAVQWLPTLRLARASARELDPAALTAGLPLRDTLQLLAPHVLSCWSPLYVGVAVLLLAIWGLWRAPETRFWWGLAGLSWLVALGANGPVVPLLYRLAPGLFVFRQQERIAVLISLALAMAAGLALARLLRGAGPPGGASGGESGGASGSESGGAVERHDEPARSLDKTAPRGSWRQLALLAGGLAAVTAFASAALWVMPASGLPSPELCSLVPVEGAAAFDRGAMADALAWTALVAGLTALAAELAARGRLRPGAAGWALVALTALDLFSVNRGHALRPLPGQGVYAEDALVSALLPRAREGRVSSEGLLPGGANAASVQGLYDTTGDSPLHPASVQRLVDEAPELVWWRILGVRFLVTEREIGEAEAGLLTELAREGERGLFEIGLPAPPTWVLPGGSVGRAEDGWLPDPSFDPQRAAVLDAGDSLPGPATEAEGSGAPPPPPAPPAWGEARLVGLDPGRARVDAVLPEDGVLALSAAHDGPRGWRAMARAEDGRALSPPVERAYGAILAVRLPAGRWTVEWTYRPRAVIVGAGVSALALIGILVLMVGGAPWGRGKPRA